jgi:hypothetical protein
MRKERREALEEQTTGVAQTFFLSPITSARNH